MNLPKLLAATSLCLLLSGLAFGRDIFVDNVHGDDLRDGSSVNSTGKAGGPCRTIARALELAQRGDRIVLAASGEPYRESLTIQAGRHSGLPDRPFEIIGSGAVLDGSTEVPRDVWEFVRGDVYRFRPARMAHHALFLGEKPVTRRPADASQGLPDLQPLEWCLYDRHVYFRAEKGKLPVFYDLRHTTLPVGITIYEARHIVISDLTIQGFQLDGVNAHDGVVDASLVGLTCRGNGRSGVSVGGSSRVQLFACLVGDNGTAQVRSEGFSHTEVINCDLVENTAPAILRDGGTVTVVRDE